MHPCKLYTFHDYSWHLLLKYHCVRTITHLSIHFVMCIVVIFWKISVCTYYLQKGGKPRWSFLVVKKWKLDVSRCAKFYAIQNSRPQICIVCLSIWDFSSLINPRLGNYCARPQIKLFNNPPTLFTRLFFVISSNLGAKGKVRKR